VQCFGYDYLGRLTQAWSEGTSACSSGPSQAAESGAAGPYWQQYSYNTVNDLTSQMSTPASGAATTTTTYGHDADGDTTAITSPSETTALSWDDAGQLASVTRAGAAADSTSYVYDAGGNLLLQDDSATLYLPGEQISEDTATSTYTSTRYYAIGGSTVAARTSSGNVYYLAGDQQGTQTIAIDNSTLTATYRYYDPYGNPAGTAATSWPGSEGFAGGTTDPSTGLVNLGAREYDPATGSFISPDPLLTPGNPQDLNAYRGTAQSTKDGKSFRLLVRGRTDLNPSTWSTGTTSDKTRSRQSRKRCCT